jgi:hypothetical protein
LSHALWAHAAAPSFLLRKLLVQRCRAEASSRC